MQDTQSQPTPASQNTTRTSNISEIQNLANQLVTLTALVAQLQSQANLANQGRPQAPREPKITDPDIYNGKRDHTRIFLVQLERVFNTQPSRFTEEHQKVNYALGRLGGAALSWSIPLQESSDICLKSFELFKQALIHVFGVIDKKDDAIRRIEALQQSRLGGSYTASNYTAEFMRLMHDTGYNEEALMHQYYKGLSDQIKDVLATQIDQPKTLGELGNLVIKIDHRLSERRREKSQHSSGPNKFKSTTHNHSKHKSSFSGSSLGTSSIGPVPMEIDTNRRGPLTEEEKQYRRDNDLCLYCGKPGHKLDNCPSKRKHKGKGKAVAGVSTTGNQDFQSGSSSGSKT
jgi:hypothetical protein